MVEDGAVGRDMAGPWFRGWWLRAWSLEFSVWDLSLWVWGFGVTRARRRAERAMAHDSADCGCGSVPVQCFEVGGLDSNDLGFGVYELEDLVFCCLEVGLRVYKNENENAAVPVALRKTLGLRF